MKVSVVVPVYKVERYIDRCIESLLNQSLQDIEIILVDDGSPDSCPQICDNYANKYNNIRVIHKKNAGLGMACNSGLEIATGKYVAFCDSDDWVDKEMYEELLYYAEKYSADIVYSGIKRINEQKQTSVFGIKKQMQKYDTKESIYNFSLGMIASKPNIYEERETPMSAKVALYKLELIKKNNIKFNSEREFVSEDLIFNLDCLLYAKSVLVIPKAYYNYWYNTNSLSQTLRIDRFQKYLILRNELLHRYPCSNDIEFKLRIDRMFIGYTRNAIKQICKADSINLKYKRKLLLDICNNDCWNNIRKTYPITLMDYAHRIILKAILNKKIMILILIFRIK